VLGRRIGRFVVERSLGAGGMGAVYAARDEVLDRLVALKVLPAAAETDPERRQRLLREARSAAALSHPNVAIVYEAGEGEGVVFLAMELVEGESLAARLARGPLSLAELVRIGGGIARGLACAHETGVIHRDLKPANVMLARDGTPKLVDFGLARPPERASPSVSRESFTGQVVGTPGYMAPEQLRDEATDARTDLFALGVVLHELWTGKAPFGLSGLSAMALTLYEEAARIEDVRAGAPPALSELVVHLLQKEPGRRPASAREVAICLEQLGASASPREPALVLEPPRSGVQGSVGVSVSASVAAVRVEAVGAPAIAPTIEVVRASRRPVESELSLLGRDEDVAALEARVAAGARLLTITGPPGIGKTALAAHLAARLGARGLRVTLGGARSRRDADGARERARRRAAEGRAEGRAPHGSPRARGGPRLRRRWRGRLGRARRARARVARERAERSLRAQPPQRARARRRERALARGRCRSSRRASSSASVRAACARAPRRGRAKTSRRSTRSRRCSRAARSRSASQPRAPRCSRRVRSQRASRRAGTRRASRSSPIARAPAR
jgi:hypothetical protein